VCGPADAAIDDTLPVAAALVHAVAPGTNWPPERVASALLEAERRPAITDPVVL